MAAWQSCGHPGRLTRKEYEVPMKSTELEHYVASAIKDPDLLIRILDLLPTSIFVKDEKLRFVFSNRAHCELIGVSAENLLGKSDADFYPEEQAGPFLARDRSVIESGETNESEEWATSQTGHTAPYLTRKSKMVGRDGSVYLIGTNTNLSEIKRREEQYRALAETVPVGIWQICESGATLYTNTLFRELLILGEGEFDGAELLQKIGAGREGFPGEQGRFETDFTGPQGEHKRILVISSGWMSQAGRNRRSAMISIVDVTEITELQRINDEISRLNRQLSDSMKQLREAQEEIVRRGRFAQLGQLTATVAHELRNPLGAVRTAVFLVERKVKDKGLGIEAQLQRINNGITRCDNIISQLLDFTRNKALQCEELDFDEWLAKTVEEEAQRLPEMVDIECNLGLNGLKVPFDPGRLNRVIINLMSNASEAMVGRGDDPSKIYTTAPKMIITTVRTARGIEISVQDNGPGISPENIAKILEPLFTTKNFGTGLGLPAVEKILEQHGGGLQVRSEPGQGACFTAWMPLARRAEEAA
jgi:PAS domain S-box-containing protein